MAAKTLLNNVNTTGPGSAVDCSPVDVEEVSFRITGNFEGVVQFEASLDGNSYFSYGGVLNGAPGLTTRTSAPGFVVFDTRAIANLRPNVVRLDSGSVTVVSYDKVSV